MDVWVIATRWGDPRWSESVTVNFSQVAHKLHINRSALRWVALAMLTQLTDELWVSWLMLGPSFTSAFLRDSPAVILHFVILLCVYLRNVGMDKDSRPLRSFLMVEYPNRNIPWSSVERTRRAPMRWNAPSVFSWFPTSKQVKCLHQTNRR